MKRDPAQAPSFFHPAPRIHSSRVALAVCICLVGLVGVARAPGQVAGDPPVETETRVAPPDFTPEIHSHSGSPLLLEIEVPNPLGDISEVTVQAEGTYSNYRFPTDPNKEPIQVVVSPFLNPGVHDLQIETRTGDAGSAANGVHTIEIGFIPFIWGENNLRFANNADYKSDIGTLGEILEQWIDQRFGGLEEWQLIPMVDFMYQFFGGRSGRCYAFSGTVVRYWLWPELLPTYMKSAYGIRGTATRYQREMNYLQLDMAFDHFVAQGNVLDLLADPPEGDARESRLATIMTNVGKVQDQIRSGRPVVVGLTGPRYHHAMVAYGYIDNPDAGFVDLLMANNWKADQDVNLRSLDAEYVRVFREVDATSQFMEWRHSEGTRRSDLDQLFIVDVEPDFDHDYGDLANLVSGAVDQLVSAGQGLLIVEGAKGAWLTQGETFTGYKRNRIVNDIEGIDFNRIDRTYRFRFPIDRTFDLTIEDDTGMRVLWVIPGIPDTPMSSGVQDTPAREDDVLITHELVLGPDGVVWPAPEIAE